ncbi:MAG: efflux RND transporter permease subunit [Prevotellaceae bacterium]|jgi:HAE1 family hydrophobic/amphiphilic exporter-1|nr:efflux RND transporter permease subunit [Prevotellaceae bacterium]
MSIYKTSINKPVTTILIFVGVIILGLFSYQKLPIDMYPEIEAPYVSVMTVYAGSNGSEIETNVTKILENSLNSVEGLKEITSVSRDNMSLISLEFDWGYDLTEAVNDIRSSIDMVRTNLPDEAEQPIIFKFNTSMMPIMMYAITADASYPGLNKILEDNMLNVLKRVDGIGNLSISGAPIRYIYIDLDPNKIDAYNLSVEQVGQAVAANNLNLAAGSIKTGKEQYQLRVESEYQSSSEINDIVVTTTAAGKQVFVRDLATVKDTIKDVTLEEKIMGKDGARLIIMKQSGANTVQVAEDVHKELEQIQKNLPPDIKITEIWDSSKNIQNSISGLSETILYALFFVILVVLFFLGKWRATIIVALAIPISLIVSFIYLFATGSSLNIISLSSLSVAIGMVVDDAIVVLENINKHIERGGSPRESAIYGTNEVWVSVIASTLVIVAVFLPLTMLGGMAGIMFKELGWIVSITILTSATVAISLTPMLASRLLSARNAIIGSAKEGIAETKTWYDKTVIAWLDRLDVAYGKLLHVCLMNKKKTLGILLAFFLLSLLPVFAGWIGTDFMPESDQGQMTVTVELQQGTRLEETMKTARAIEAKIDELLPEVLIYTSTAGTDDEGGIASLFTDQANDIITMNIRTTEKSERERSITEIAEVLRSELNKMPEIINYQVSTSSGMGGAESNNVAVEIYGYDFTVTNALAAELKGKISKIEGARDITISRKNDRPELEIVCNKEKLARAGLSSSQVASFVRNRVQGYAAGYLKEDGDEYDIIVRLKEENRNSLSEIEELTMITPRGEQIKLKELAEIKEYWSPPNIERKRRERMVSLTVTPVNTSLGELASAIQVVINKTEIPSDIIVQVGGAYEDQQESFADMGTLFLLIIILVYIVMASQFESFSKPFIIMMSVPFAMSGAIMALWITGTSLSIVGALGVILLVGIVVKNGIVLIDYINLMRDRDYELNEAIAMSGRSRLRPVVMTSLTTILGMVPMALSTAEGSETWVPMGIVVIGGATVSTLLTLLIVPVFYAVMSRHGERNKEAQLRKTFVFFDRELPEEDRKELEGK